MATTVVDASVAFNVHLNAPQAESAADALAAAEITLAPDLIVSEVANAAWVFARAGKITEQEGAAIVALLPSHIDRIVGSEQLAASAYQIATALKHPVYDCMYLALAEREDAELVTFDKRLADTVRDTRWAALVSCLK